MTFTRRFLFAASCGLLLAPPAYAIFNVSTPGIKKGQVIIETRNRWDVDDLSSRDGLKMHALKTAYGVTDRWELEATGTLQDTPRQGYSYVFTEMESKFRFFDPGEYWLDFALKISYEWKQQKGRADQVKSKFLFQKKLGDFTHTANVNLAKEIGSDASRDTQLSTGWQTKYRLTPYFQPGFEAFGSFGEISDMQGYSEQSHRAGPMFFGEIAPGLSYQAGYLFGTSKAAEDGSFKLFLKYEFSL